MLPQRQRFGQVIHQQRQLEESAGKRERVREAGRAECGVGAGSCSCVASWQTVPKNGLMKMNAPLAAAAAAAAQLDTPLDAATHNQQQRCAAVCVSFLSLPVYVCVCVCASCLQFFMPPL